MKCFFYFKVMKFYIFSVVGSSLNNLSLVKLSLYPTRGNSLSKWDRHRDQVYVCSFYINLKFKICQFVFICLVNSFVLCCLFMFPLRILVLMIFLIPSPCLFSPTCSMYSSAVTAHLINASLYQSSVLLSVILVSFLFALGVFVSVVFALSSALFCVKCLLMSPYSKCICRCRGTW